MIGLLLFLTIPELQKFYEEGEYLKVIERGKKILKDTTLSEEDRAGIHLILGFCYSALEEEKLAKLEFLEVLVIKPLLKLDSTLISPKIIKIFNEAKEMVQKIKKIKGKELKIEKGNLSQKGKTINKNMIDIFFPGVYYFRKNEKFKGSFLLVGSSLSLVLGGIFTYLEREAHKEYLKAREREKIEEKYRKYSLYYKAKIISIGVGGGIYLLNLILLAKG